MVVVRRWESREMELSPPPTQHTSKPSGLCQPKDLNPESRGKWENNPRWRWYSLINAPVCVAGGGGQLMPWNKIFPSNQYSKESFGFGEAVGCVYVLKWGENKGNESLQSSQSPILSEVWKGWNEFALWKTYKHPRKQNYSLKGTMQILILRSPHLGTWLQLWAAALGWHLHE